MTCLSSFSFFLHSFMQLVEVSPGVTPLNIMKLTSALVWHSVFLF